MSDVEAYEAECAERLDTLVSNLVIGAALCRAFDDGYRIGQRLMRHSSRYPHTRLTPVWLPGCGFRPATPPAARGE